MNARAAKTSEPKEKLDAMTIQTDGAADVALEVFDVVNGPEGLDWSWDAVDWRHAEEQVRRLRQRIFKATQEKDLKKVRNLQKLMLRSFSNTLVSVRRVTEINAGRKTAGIDGRVVLTSRGKSELVRSLQRNRKPTRARPVKRVYIAKGKGKQRPLGIPVISDRARQAQTVNALEPEWEARFEQKSFGFRPGRGCHDAIEAIFNTACGKNAKRLWVLDADLQSAFDQISHKHLLRQIDTFPGRERVEHWLKAGVVEKGHFTETLEGTPQGGVISPLLLNIALHGMEHKAGARYRTNSRDTVEAVRGTPALIRYADDLIALCHSRDEAENVKAQLSEWLEPRGLSFNEDKTRIVHLSQGFDFLGFNIRRYHNGKLLIKPSNTAVKRIRKRLADEMRILRGANSAAVTAKLNPIIKGWACYYRTVVSSRTFNALDAYVWRLTYRWALRGHRNKPKNWVVDRYYGARNASRKDRWVFGDRDSGAYLIKFSWIPIIRHQAVKGAASPDDPALTNYWAERRRRRKPPPLDAPTLRLLKVQKGKCPECKGYLLHADREPQNPEDWGRWFVVIRKALRKQAVVLRGGNEGDRGHHQLVHAYCQRRSAEVVGTERDSAIPASP